jgi:4-amino-4-deoxychorismate lyase
VLAQLELRTRGLEEGILLSRSGTVVGCTSANLFALTGETLVTPRIELTGINGVMRRVVLEACTRAAIPVREAVMVPAELISADALFLTNAVVGIREIQSLGMQTFASASICDRVRKAVAEYADA